MRALPTIIVLLVLVLAGAGPAAARTATGPAGDAFYTPPAGALSAGAGGHGSVIWSRPAGAARSTLVLYRSRSLRGAPVAVSGVVTVPAGRAPKGGWPVISWAHGTTGLADGCAPSRNPAFERYLQPSFDAWLRAGYAIVRTDYEGLGTPGPHPYLVGRAEAHDVLDMVRAARHLNRSLGRRIVVIGHSQGGQAALWSTALARRYTPELRLRGTIAFAPVSQLSEQLPFITALRSPALTPLFVSMLKAIEDLGVGVDVPAMLSDAAAARFGLVDTLCTGQLAAPDAFGPLTPADVLRPGADIKPFLKAMDTYADPEQLHLRTPVVIEQGLADRMVLPLLTSSLAVTYRERETPLTYRRYPGLDHSGVVTAAKPRADALRSLRRWKRG